jgi:hypothetical protein
MGFDIAIYTKHSIIMNDKDVMIGKILFLWICSLEWMNFIIVKKSQILGKIKHAKSVFGVKIFTYFGNMQILIL